MVMEKSYSCEKCDQTFLRNAHLKRHIESKHEETCYPCAICGIGVKRKVITKFVRKKNSLTVLVLNKCC